MGYIDAMKATEALFTEATPIASPQSINQAGNYLLFGGAKPINGTEDRLAFLLVLAANSYSGKNGLMEKVEDMRKRILESAFDFSLLSIKRAELLSQTLFSVVLEVNITINTQG